MIEPIKNWDEVGSPEVIATRLNELIVSHNELVAYVEGMNSRMNELETEVDILHKQNLHLVEAMAKLITK